MEVGKVEVLPPPNSTGVLTLAYLSWDAKSNIFWPIIGPLDGPVTSGDGLVLRDYDSGTSFRRAKNIVLTGVFGVA